ncbi:MAG: NAD(P)H-hydrate epimerase [Chloroflexi bacterium]|nr:NAD(P)H-hydrate epimerase [Chloroflexota bacterium]
MQPGIPNVDLGSLPSVTRDQMREVDRLMIEEYRIQLVQMMENAGLQLARLTQKYLDELGGGQHVLVLAGRGNNGGGGLAAGRRLAAWGANVAVLLATGLDAVEGVPLQQLDILQRMDVTVQPFAETLPEHDVLLDALIGYGLQNSLRAPVSRMIDAANDSTAPIVSLDVPSGVDVDTGEAPGSAIRASATLTLALPKAGLIRPEARQFVGELYLADIGVPSALYERIGLGAPRPFAAGQLVRLTGLS